MQFKVGRLAEEWKDDNQFPFLTISCWKDNLSSPAISSQLWKIIDFAEVCAFGIQEINHLVWKYFRKNVPNAQHVCTAALQVRGQL